ncbi:MAG: TIGR01777 family protein [Planctomycetes bacterium]|nr:TIGR01777 family protein [Planctomycetota bacterium]
MRVLVTGSSGLIGSALVSHLEAGGHTVTRLVRSAPREGEVRWDPAAGAIDAGRLDGYDAAVHLAGETIAGRWTAARKARILTSRVHGTRLLSASLAGLRHPPAVLACASGVGFYGDRGEETLTEESAPGSGFLPQVARSWEAAADPARAAGIRVAHLRFGVVLSRRGGALPRMLLPFRLGLGGPIGSGGQFISWVALDDAVRAIAYAIEREGLAGPINVAAPDSVTNRDFARTLGRVLRRPAFCRVPAWVVRTIMGEMGRELLLSSTRAVPARLAAAGFSFRYPGLEGALRHVLGKH